MVSESFGHASPVMTMQVYAHDMPTMPAEVAQRFAALIGGRL